MDSQARLFVKCIVPILVGAAVAIPCGHLEHPSLAKEWKAPEKFVGARGQLGTYEEVQEELAHFEWQDVRPTRESPTHSLRELYDGQMAWRDALQNVEVSFAYSLQRQRNTARVIALKQQKRDVPDDFAFEAQIAMKGEKRLTHIRDVTPGKASKMASGAPGAKLLATRFPEFLYAYNGSEMKSFEPLRSMGHIHRAKLDSVDSRHMWYFDSVSIPTGARAAKQRGSAWYVPTALSLSSAYRVLPTLQLVDGFLCHVATSGPDTIWIDVAHGSCMRRRVWFQMTNFDRAPVLAFVYVNKDFRQYADDIWLPHQCYRLDFSGTLEPANSQGLLAEVHTVAAKTIHVNSVPDDLFELTFPPGTSVQDLVANKSYFVPHGEHLLDEAIARANPIVNGEVRPFRSRGRFRLVWRQLLILNAVMLCLFGGRVLWRLRSGRADGV
jgi:hypothetical protein